MLCCSHWRAGAAGRLASHLAAGPGTPSARAILPETLDSPDELLASLSPSHAAARRASGTGGSTRLAQASGVQAAGGSSSAHAAASAAPAGGEDDADMLDVPGVRLHVGLVLGRRIVMPILHACM